MSQLLSILVCGACVLEAHASSLNAPDGCQKRKTSAICQAGIPSPEECYCWASPFFDPPYPCQPNPVYITVRFDEQVTSCPYTPGSTCHYFAQSTLPCTEFQYCISGDIPGNPNSCLISCYLGTTVYTSTSTVTKYTSTGICYPY